MACGLNERKQVEKTGIWCDSNLLNTKKSSLLYINTSNCYQDKRPKSSLVLILLYTSTIWHSSVWTLAQTLENKWQYPSKCWVLPLGTGPCQALYHTLQMLLNKKSALYKQSQVKMFSQLALVSPCKEHLLQYESEKLCGAWEIDGLLLTTSFYA